MKRIIVAAVLLGACTGAVAKEDCDIYGKEVITNGTFYQEEGGWQWRLPLDWEWVQHDGTLKSGDNYQSFADSGYPRRVIQRVKALHEQTGKDTIHGRKLYRHCRRGR